MGIGQRLLEVRPEIHFVVTCTSRAMRQGEKEGVDYFFVTKNKFREMIDHNELLEHAIVYGEYKGIPKRQAKLLYLFKELVQMFFSSVLVLSFNS